MTDIGFTWGNTEELYWLRNDAGDYKRIDTAFMYTLLTLAHGERQIEDLTSKERTAVTVLHEEGYLREGDEVTELPTPPSITRRGLWLRLLAFAVAFVLLTAYISYRMIVAGTSVPTIATVSIGFLRQLLLSVPIFVVMTLVHEAGHYTVAQSYFKPSLRFSRLNGIFPAIVTTTNDAWRCPRSVRIWINLAGPFFDLLQCLVLAALSLFVFPESYLLAILPIFEYVQILFSLNPLMRGDGYWILVDWFGPVNLHTRGMADLKNLHPTVPALYVLSSGAFTVLGFGTMLFFVANLAGVI